MSNYNQQRKNELLQKLQQRTITPFEQEELRNILEIEKKNASGTGDLGKVVGAILLLAALAALFDDSDSKRRKKR